LGYGVTLPVFALLARFPDSVFNGVVHVLVGGCPVWLPFAALRSAPGDERFAPRPALANTVP
jgi:hypothetical protein